MSVANNAFGADLAIDHTKIRVLYLEGSNESYVEQRMLSRAPAARSAGPIRALQAALMEDPDVECTAVVPGAVGRRLLDAGENRRALADFPRTPSQLFAYDAIILSNVPRDVLSDQHLAWIDEWIGRRGGGLCMVGGPNSFASGRWNETSVGQMLPVELAPGGTRLGRGGTRASR